MDKLIIKGAREHNLKNIDLELPRNKLIVISGLSGSGKSSLADSLGKKLGLEEEKLDILLKHVDLFDKTWGNIKKFDTLKKYFTG